MTTIDGSAKSPMAASRVSLATAPRDRPASFPGIHKPRVREGWAPVWKSTRCESIPSGDSIEKRFQRGKEILCRQTRRLFFGYDIDIPIPCDPVLVQPEKLTAQPLDPVADNGVSDLLRYGNPQARPLLARRADAHQKMPAVKNVLRTRQPKELGAFQYPVVFGEKKSQPCPYSLGRSTPDAGLSAIRFQRLKGRSYAERRFLPLARRRLMTFLPAGVDIRFRKPWVRFRLILLG